MMDFIEYLNQWYYERSFYLNGIYYYQIHITKRCQNKCKHCYYKEIGSDTTDIDIELLRQTIAKVADNARRLSLTPRIDFTGGDPFLYPHLSEAVQACRQSGIKYGFKCNPDFFLEASTDDIYALIRDCSEISISVDGFQRQHDSWRGEGNFSKTIQAAGKIKEHNFYLRLNTTVSLDNLSSLIPLIDFLINEGLIVDDYTWARYWSISNKDQIIPAALLPRIFDEYTEYLKQLFKTPEFYYQDSNGQVKPRIFFGFKEHQWFPYFVSRGYIDDNVLKRVVGLKNCLNCTATKHLYVMDPDLTIFRCRKLTESAGNYLEEVEKESLFSLETSSMCAKCVHYNVCGGCGAMSLSFTGDYNDMEPGCAFFASV